MICYLLLQPTNSDEVDIRRAAEDGGEDDEDTSSQQDKSDANYFSADDNLSVLSTPLSAVLAPNPRCFCLLFHTNTC